MADPRNRWLVIVAARRPRCLDAIEENDYDLGVALQASYALFAPHYDPDRIFVISYASAFEAATSGDRAVNIPESVRRDASRTAFIKVMMEEINVADSDVFVYMTGHGGTDVDRDGDFVSHAVPDSGEEYWTFPRVAASRRWWYFLTEPATEGDALEASVRQCGQGYDYAPDYGTMAGPVNVGPYALHWRDLMVCVAFMCARRASPDLAPPLVANLTLVVGACYSGGLFEWLRNPGEFLDDHDVAALASVTGDAAEGFDAAALVASLPVYAVTSTNEYYMAGTWFWFEWLRLASEALRSASEGDKAVSENETSAPMPSTATWRHLAAALQGLNPSTDYTTAFSETGSRGDDMDALLVSQFEGVAGGGDRLVATTIAGAD